MLNSFSPLAYILQTSVQSWHDSTRSLWLARVVENFVTSLRDWLVVSWLIRNVNTVGTWSSENVKSSIALRLEVGSSDLGPNSSFLVNLHQFLSFFVVLVAQVYQIVRCASLVLLSSIEIVSFCFENLLLFVYDFFHSIKALGLPTVSLLS